MNENMNNCKYAYQSYGHLLVRIKRALRLGSFNNEDLINDISNLDNFLLIFALLLISIKKITIKNTVIKRLCPLNQ